MFQNISSLALKSSRDFLSTSLLTIGLVLTVAEPAFAAEAPGKKPLRILLITGGCCHHYAIQTQALKEAVAKLAQAEWTVVNEGGTGTKAQIPLYENPDWSKGFDVVVHNECFADTTDQEYIRKITQAHKAGVAAVVIHCAMHTYRATDIDDWRGVLRVTTPPPGYQGPCSVKD